MVENGDAKRAGEIFGCDGDVVGWEGGCERENFCHYLTVVDVVVFENFLEFSISILHSTRLVVYSLLHDTTKYLDSR